MSREARIKLYKRIQNQYYNNVERLPWHEKEAAEAAGYLVQGFEHFPSHNEAIKVAKERINSIDKKKIADAFLYSLSTSLCEYRSPLLSYYYIKSIIPHELEDSFMIIGMGQTAHTGICNICDYGGDYDSFGLANYALIRKYLAGSVCWFSYYLQNCIMDITQYIAMPTVKASTRDIEILIESLHLVKTLNPSDKAGAYIKRLYQSKIIPNSTRDQISTLIDTLGSLNILHRDGDYAITKGKDKYDSTYRDPLEHKNDHPFPLTHWRASDGVDADEVKTIFNIAL